MKKNKTLLILFILLFIIANVILFIDTQSTIASLDNEMIVLALGYVKIASPIDILVAIQAMQLLLILDGFLLALLIKKAMSKNYYTAYSINTSLR